MSAAVATILHLEDSDLDAELVLGKLSTLGRAFEIRRVSDRREFLDQLSGRKYDLILSDYQLPSFGGFEALQLTREIFPDVPFIFVSGAIGEETAVDMLKLGATDYVLKQRLARLVPAVERALAESRQREEHKAAEEALHEQQKLFRTTLSSIGDGVISTDTNRRVTFLNAEAERLTGWKSDEALGRTVDEIYRIIHAANGQRVACPVQKVLESGRTQTFADATILISRHGGECVIDDSAAPIKDDAGNALGVVLVFRDLTEKKQTETQLRESEQRFEFVCRTSGVGFWYCDLPFDVLEWDANVKAHFHLPPDAVVTIETFFARIHPDDREPTRRAIEHSIREHLPYDVDYRTVDPASGDEKWIRAIGRTFYAPDGTARRFDGVTLDVTDRKRVERQWRASEERFRTTADQAPVLIWITDSSNGCVWLNRPWLEFTGRTMEQEFGHGWTEGIHAEDYERCMETFGSNVDRRQAFTMEYRLRRHDGTYRWMLDSGQPLLEADGEFTGYIGTCIDITERKRQEDEIARLLRDEKRHSTLFTRVAEASRSVNAVLSTESIARILTEEARSIIGAERAVTSITLEVDDRQVIRAIAVAPDVRAATPQEFSSTEEAIYTEVCRTHKPLRWTKSELQRRPESAESKAARRCALAAPLVSHGGRILGVVQLADKQADGFTEEDEAVLVQLAAIAAVGIENARLYDSLREQDRRKDEFLATLAHELRNPLAPVRTGLEILKLADDAEQSQMARDMMERQLKHMVRLVDDLLDVSRVSRGKVELRREYVELRQVIDLAMETSLPLFKSARHELTVTLPPEPLCVFGDLTRLAQVLSNLLNNAAKYTADGGRIVLSAAQDGNDLVIRIDDSGVGIPSEMLPKVFDLFTQVGRTIDRSQGGLGIGLSLVKRLVEMHDGTVVAESLGPGKGSTFIVRLPLAKKRTSRVSAPSGDGAAKSNGHASRRILVVDDNADAAASLALLLRFNGGETRVAHSGPAAIDAALEFRPEIVFLDIGLPGLNGYEVASRMRQEPELSRTVLIALTGWGSDEDRKRSLAAGFNFHLTKPVEAAVVTDMLARFATHAAHH